MNSIILLPLLLSAAMAAPMTNIIPRMNNPGVFYYPLQFAYPLVYGGLSRQDEPGLTIRTAQQAAAALSNLSEYTVKKSTSFLCLLDFTCPEAVLSPYPPGRKTTTTTTAAYPSTTTEDALFTTTITDALTTTTEDALTTTTEDAPITTTTTTDAPTTTGTFTAV